MFLMDVSFCRTACFTTLIPAQLKTLPKEVSFLLVPSFVEVFLLTKSHNYYYLF